jgi:hypothetical protein
MANTPADLALLRPVEAKIEAIEAKVRALLQEKAAAEAATARAEAALAKVRAASAPPFDASELGRIIGTVLSSPTDRPYHPTLSAPEERGMADAFDAAMLALGRDERAWRGSLASARTER